jgi:large subunit ribosomal protein L18
MSKSNSTIAARAKRISRIRKNISGTNERPRLRVFKSNKHIYAQIIDDKVGVTLVAMSTVEKDFDKTEKLNKKESAKTVGLMIAQRALAAGISKVVFDRGGYLYHGRVKSLSEGAREGGLQF